MVQQYLQHSKDILTSGKFKPNERRGVGRIYLFGYQNRYDLQEGFPALTTKRIGFKTVTHELLWFLRGETNIKYLVDNNVHIWDSDAFHWNLEAMVKEGVFSRVFEKDSPEYVGAKEEYIQRIKEDESFAASWGELGPVYGSQWIHWPFFDIIGKDEEGRELYVRNPEGINQIDRVLEGMRKNPTSSRYIITAWNPVEVPNMALPPCHTFWHLDSDGEVLNLQLYQRSCDMFLGVPFNIASYSLLDTILAQQLGLEPGEFVHTFGDVHFYTGSGERAKWYERSLREFKYAMHQAKCPEDHQETINWINRVAPEEEGKEGMDHVTGILEQLQRKPKALPKVTVADKPYNELTIDDFTLADYDPYPSIKRTLIVG